MAAPTRSDVANWLGIPALPEDQRLTDVTEAAISWTQKRRSITPSGLLWLEHDVVVGTTMYAALLYSSRAQPQGFAGFETLGSFQEDTGMAITQIFRLVGADVPIA